MAAVKCWAFILTERDRLPAALSSECWCPAPAATVVLEASVSALSSNGWQQLGVRALKAYQPIGFHVESTIFTRG